MQRTSLGLTLVGPLVPRSEEVFTPEALAFLAEIGRRFEGERRLLLEGRTLRRGRARPLGFLPATADIRNSPWSVAAVPADLQERQVEITGPVDRKMMVNALNSGASCFMADFEDSLSPTWLNVVNGHVNVMDAAKGALRYEAPDGRVLAPAAEAATLIVRPRGWHLNERHLPMGGEPMSASLFDFGLFAFHCARALVARGTGPYVYLPKLENHEEARLWARVFRFAEDALRLDPGTFRATVLIETLPAAFEMDEILYELRDYAAGLNAGRWDYLFSAIKTMGTRPEAILPDRALVTMEVPFMRAYADLLVATCHKRGAHAIGGMAAFVPSRQDPMRNAEALAKVEADKRREVGQGFDGTWVAHPDLVPVARRVFREALGDRPHQKDNFRMDVQVDEPALLDLRVPGGRVTEVGVEKNAEVALEYLAHWLDGRGAVALNHLMEDAATAEIARAQLWQWAHAGVRTTIGRLVTPQSVGQALKDAKDRLGAKGLARLEEAYILLRRLVQDAAMEPFMTSVAYRALHDGPGEVAVEVNRNGEA